MNDEKNEGNIVRERIAGWLVLLAVILWFNLFLATKVVMEVVNRPANSRIIYLALYVDIAIGCGCIWLLRLLRKRDLRFPGHYIAVNLLIYASWTMAIILAGVGAHRQWVAVGLQNLFLTPYVFRSKRVERTFPSLSSPQSAWERLRDRARRWGPVGLLLAMLGLLLLIPAMAVFLSTVV